jgi:hypothetical protein
MKDLAAQRCFNHPHREAVACCPECGRYFCRECVVEHDDRLLCASCIAKLLAPTRAGRFRLAGLVRLGQFLFGFMVLWLFFYYVGQALLSLPSSFHEGTVWRSPWREAE